MVGGKIKQKQDVIGGRGLESSDCSGCPIFILWLIWICTTTRHHAESNINILLTRNFPIDSGVRQWNHPLMIPLHCLWAKSNNRTRGHFNVTWIDFAFVLISFVHMHDTDCCSIVG